MPFLPGVSLQLHNKALQCRCQHVQRHHRLLQLPELCCTQGAVHGHHHPRGMKKRSSRHTTACMCITSGCDQHTAQTPLMPFSLQCSQSKWLWLRPHGTGKAHHWLSGSLDKSTSRRPLRSESKLGRHATASHTFFHSRTKSSTTYEVCSMPCQPCKHECTSEPPPDITI